MYDYFSGNGTGADLLFNCDNIQDICGSDSGSDGLAVFLRFKRLCQSISKNAVSKGADEYRNHHGMFRGRNYHCIGHVRICAEQERQLPAIKNDVYIAVIRDAVSLSDVNTGTLPSDTDDGINESFNGSNPD